MEPILQLQMRLATAQPDTFLDSRPRGALCGRMDPPHGQWQWPGAGASRCQCCRL